VIPKLVSSNEFEAKLQNGSKTVREPSPIKPSPMPQPLKTEHPEAVQNNAKDIWTEDLRRGWEALVSRVESQREEAKQEPVKMEAEAEENVPVLEEDVVVTEGTSRAFNYVYNERCANTCSEEFLYPTTTPSRRASTPSYFGGSSRSFGVCFVLAFLTNRYTDKVDALRYSRRDVMKVEVLDILKTIMGLCVAQNFTRGSSLVAGTLEVA
jgi:hypothetical protein